MNNSSKVIYRALIIVLMSTLNAKDSFVLITVLYNEVHKQRKNEYITCFERNLAHGLIDSIHVLYDTSRDDGKNELLQVLKKAGISLSYTTGRPTYGYCLDLVNKYYPKRKIILSNADIYFNDTLCLLKEYDLTNKFLTLTRWNVRKNGRMRLQHATGGRKNIWSHDTWIFQTPLKKFHDAIEMSTISCDSRIAYEAKKSGLVVDNPCLDIQCCHLHLSQVRHIETTSRGLTAGVPWKKLKN